MKKNALTLVELLVVIAIISILAGMLMPALENAIDSARAIACMNNHKQIGTTATLYANDYEGWVKMAWFSGKSITGSPWLLLQEGYLDQDIDLDDIDTLNDIFKCPSGPKGNNTSQSGIGAIGFGGGGDTYASRAGIPVYNTTSVFNTNSFYINFFNLPAKVGSDFDGAAESIFELPVYGDCAMTDENAGSHAYGNILAGYPNGGNVSFHIRHLDRANGWFLDGHSESMDEVYIGGALSYGVATW